MKTKRKPNASQQKIKKTPRRNRRKQKKVLKTSSTYNAFLKNFTNQASPAVTSPQIIRNRNYVRKLQKKADQSHVANLQRNSTSNRSFEDELNDYSSLRLSLNPPSTSSAAAKDAKRESMEKVIKIPDDDSEIEEGEIVEREVTQCVDLIEESFSVLKQSRKITDLSPVKEPLFYEDRGTTEFKHVAAPLYSVVGSPNDNDDVILLDSTASSMGADDSVIFVSEVQKPLEKPKGLLSPAINELMKLSGVKLTPAKESPEMKNLKLSPGQVKKRERVAKWRKKKQIEYAQKEVAESMGISQRPSTSTAAKAKEKSIAANGGKSKRIILIDGSNVAISHAKSKFGKNFDEKSPQAFSVEGLNVALEHFLNMGFQVKAVVPEYRLIRDKSSNQQLLHQLKNDGYLIPTPSKAYDDRILLESASRLNAAVVSNDYFRDFKLNAKFLEVLNNNQIRYNWVFNEFVLTEDSYGRKGPRLDDILYVPK